MNARLSIILAALTSTALAGPPELSFKPAGDGFFTFDTGVVRGRLRADTKSQGIPTFRDCETDRELAYGGGNPGLLNYYRLFSAGKRWSDTLGDALRVMGKTAKLLPDGAVQIRWPAADGHPIEIIATYRWKGPNVLDLETTVKPSIALDDVEVFLGSYFNKNFRSRVYLKAPRHAGGKPTFLVPEVNPLVAGTYLAFPRDLAAAHMMYDGRWELGTSPVQWSITRYYAAPLAVQQNVKDGYTFILLSRPEDCFAVCMPYNMDPPDGVAGHYSTYLCLFGCDLEAGQSAAAHTRLIVGRQISQQDALKAYNDFLTETK